MKWTQKGDITVTEMMKLESAMYPDWHGNGPVPISSSETGKVSSIYHVKNMPKARQLSQHTYTTVGTLPMRAGPCLRQ